MAYIVNARDLGRTYFRLTQSSSFGKILKFQRKYCLAMRYNLSKLYVYYIINRVYLSIATF